MYDSYIRPYKDRNASPPISIYLLNDDSPSMDKLSCVYCKRTIADVKGQIDAIISSPMSTVDFGIAVNIKCKLCKQDYRLLVNSVS